MRPQGGVGAKAGRNEAVSDGDWLDVSVADTEADSVAESEWLNVSVRVPVDAIDDVVEGVPAVWLCDADSDKV